MKALRSSRSILAPLLPLVLLLLAFDLLAPASPAMLEAGAGRRPVKGATR